MTLTPTGVQEFLNKEPVNVEENADKSQYIPIWQVERDLDMITMCNWSRYDHKYSFHADNEGTEWLATSHLLRLNYGIVERILVCSSFINPTEYGITNILQTGIAEATKAGVKVLGKRFGIELNDRTVPKGTAKVRKQHKAKPDKSIMDAYLKAVMENDTLKQAQLLAIYDIKTSEDYAKS
jgi:isopropylmalate/homocitrate/citramalate synthase